MLKINKKVEYALMALKFMADKASVGELTLTSAREVCDEMGTPFDTTAKVMQLMNNQDILKSVKGIKGGYSLNKPLSDITYMELVRLIEGKSHIGRVCVGHKGTCELFGKCNISTPVEQLNRKLNSFLETLTLADLLHGSDFNHLHKYSSNHLQEKSV
ncbi:MAG: RrF2 family transcriptional regulator [Bacteriovorax sp.]